jgi:hypothetical protein
LPEATAGEKFLAAAPTFGARLPTVERWAEAPLSDFRLNQLNRISDGLDLVDVIVIDFDIEGILELEHDIDESSRIHFQIVENMRAQRDAFERLLVLDIRGENLDHFSKNLGLIH